MKNRMKSCFFCLWWRVVERKKGGGSENLVESGGDSPFFMGKTLEIQAFFMEKILRKSGLVGCFFEILVLQCG